MESPQQDLAKAMERGLEMDSLTRMSEWSEAE
jgi:hypothetical protein